MENEELVYELLDEFSNLKRTNFSYMFTKDDLSHNERMVLFIIHNLNKDDKISLSIIRDKMKLAPSTITPIISSLEKRGFIERKIDESDRRNIYICLSNIGRRFTEKVDNELKNMLYEYIKYMGKKDTNEIIRLIKKTREFIVLKKGESRC